MNGAFSVKDSTVGKGIAILLMLFHHLFNDYEEYAGYAVSYFPFSGDRLTYLAVLSKICVAVFVFISGYGIAASFGGLCRDGRLPGAGEVGRFVRRRYVRLMAAYWCASPWGGRSLTPTERVCARSWPAVPSMCWACPLSAALRRLTPPGGT